MSTLTTALDRTRALPVVRLPALEVLNVAEPEGGIQNDSVGSVIASAIRFPRVSRVISSPWTEAVAEGFVIVTDEIQSLPPAMWLTWLTNCRSWLRIKPSML